jgi:hypothetical protein
MAGVVGCAVFTRQDPDGSFMVDSRHYEGLKDAIEANESGWVELDAAEGEGGKVLLRVRDIVTLVLQTESVVAAAAARQVTDG